jgi:hypothetical protein
MLFFLTFRFFHPLFLSWVSPSVQSMNDLLAKSMHEVQAKEIILSVTPAPFLEEEFRLELAPFASLPWHALGFGGDCKIKMEFLSCKCLFK